MKFILGGRMGDLIHELYVVKNTPGVHDLYITDRRDLHSDGFLYDLDKTIEELKPVLMMQDYVNSIQKYEGEVTENTDINLGIVNLNMWRRYVYSASWTNLLSKVFNVPVNGKAWMKSGIMSDRYSPLVHCSTPEPRRGDWSRVDLAEGYFFGTKQEYDVFGNTRLTHLIPNSLTSWFIGIGSCKKFIGNQSLPLAIAHALDVPRIGVLNETDKNAYIGEEKIFKNFQYVL